MMKSKLGSSDNKFMNRRHKSVDRAKTRKLEQMDTQKTPFFDKTMTSKNSRPDNDNKMQLPFEKLNLQKVLPPDKAANLVNLNMHQDENIFSEDVSKTFMSTPVDMTSIDEVPESPDFPNRSINNSSLAMVARSRTSGNRSRTINIAKRMHGNLDSTMDNTSPYFNVHSLDSTEKQGKNIITPNESVFTRSSAVSTTRRKRSN